MARPQESPHQSLSKKILTLSQWIGIQPFLNFFLPGSFSGLCTMLTSITTHYKATSRAERVLGSRGTRIALNLVSSQDSLFEK
jgi:hypothetical protein